jgi:hypothetical protein
MKAFLRTIFILCLWITFDIRAQTPASLGISMELMYNGFELPDGAVVYAPATVFITPYLQTSLPVHAGDTVAIDFFTDGRKMWSDKAVCRTN